MATAPTPPPPQRSSGVPVVVIVLIVLVIVVFIVGVLAAIAIPSFIRYTRRAKIAEADVNITAIARGVEAQFAETGTAPAALPPTPAPGCQRRPWPADAAPGWAALGFAPADPLYYSYSIEPMAEGRGVWVRAMGDLDCDGVFSRFERSVTMEGVGLPVLGPLIRTDEME